MVKMKDSYDFGTKKLARQKLKEFVEKTYPQNQRRHLKVLTMLGHQDHELKEIWDNLGVPRSNIYVVEGWSQPYEILEENNAYGTNLLPKQSVEDFIKNGGENMNFDVINLDYQGYLDPKKGETIQRIAYNGNLNGKGVLATWFSGRREKDKAKKMKSKENLVEIAKTINIINTLQKMPSSYGGQEIALEVAKSLEEKLMNMQNGNSRSDFISDTVINYFQKANRLIGVHPLIEKLELEKRYFEYIQDLESFQVKKRIYEEFIEGEGYPEFKGDFLFEEKTYNILKEVKKRKDQGENVNLSEYPELFETFNEFSAPFIYEVLSKKIKGYLGDISGKERMNVLADISAISSLFAKEITNSYLDKYTLKENERYFYRNEKGTPMFVDLNLFEGIKPLKIQWKMNKDGKIVIPKSCLKNIRRTRNILQRQHEAIDSNIAKYRKSSRQEIVYSEPERITLPFTKENVYQLINEGKSDEEIKQIIPDVKSLAAYKAWTTMKEKGIKPKRKVAKLEQEVRTSEFPEPRILEKPEKINGKLTKNEAIEFLQLGVTPEEIIKDFPDEFTKAQLGAFKRYHLKE